MTDDKPTSSSTVTAARPASSTDRKERFERALAAAVKALKQEAREGILIADSRRPAVPADAMRAFFAGRMH